METNNKNNPKTPLKINQPNDAQAENGDADHDEKGLAGREDERSHNIDGKISIKEMREGNEKNKEDDAMNYKNDREHGTFNPKNI